MNSAAKDIFQKYYSQLVKMLPMDDSMFVAELYSQDVLTHEDKRVIMSQSTTADKVVVFLDRVIAPSIIAGYDEKFYKLLECMEHYELTVIRELAKSINAALRNDGCASDSGEKRFRLEQCDKLMDVHASRDVLKNCPTIKQLNRYSHYFCPKWYILGIKLLNDVGMDRLEIIKHDYPNDSERCCMEMLNLWLSREPSANWKELIDALHCININAVAAQILEDLYGEGPYQKAKSRSCEEPSTIGEGPYQKAKSRSCEEPSTIGEGPYQKAKSRSCEEPSRDIRNLTPQDLAQFKAPDKVNTCPSMKDLHRFIVHQYSEKWKMLGLLLHLSSSVINIIAYDHHSTNECMATMLKKWIYTDPEATWGKLLKAIELLK